MHPSVHHLIVRLLRGFFLLLGALPQRGVDGLARFTGRLWYNVDGRHRRVALANLTRVFGGEKSPSDIEALARRVFYNLVRIPFEIGWSMRWKKQDCLRYFDIQGREKVQQAQEKGRGVLLLTGHVGNWELMAPLVLAMGTPVTVPYRPIAFAPADTFFAQMRSRFGVRMVPKKKAMRKILRPLQNGEFVCVLFDQTARVSMGVHADFFGQKAWTNKGLALIALKTGAPVLSVFILRDGGRFRVEIGDEIPLISSGDRKRDVLANTVQYNRALENVIRRYPDQWFWVHDRWKERHPAKSGMTE